MKYLQPDSTNPSFNIAFEEYAFEVLAEKDDIFILWINHSSIIIGKNQNTYEEINDEYCKANNIQIARRRSGGGAVYQDVNNLNYTIISKNSANREFDFKSFSIPIIDTLKEMGISATFNGRNDLLIEDQKFCGNSQFIKGDKIMHHGCILFDVDLTVLTKALKVSSDKYTSKGKKSVRSRVTNIKEHLIDKNTDIFDFIELLKKYMASHYPLEEYQLSEQEIAEVKKLQAKRNDDPQWIYGNNPDFSFHNQAKFLGGKVEVKILINHNKIENIKFYGDFFGIKEIENIEKMLVGKEYDYQLILNLLAEVNINEYFYNITKEEIVNLMFK